MKVWRLEKSEGEGSVLDRWKQEKIYKYIRDKRSKLVVRLPLER